MKRLLPLGAAFLALSACGGEFPRDPRGTLERVRAERSFRVGMIAPAASGPELDRLLKRIGQASGASPNLREGDLESLLNQLEKGELDLVLGRLEKKSPWARRVTIGPPLRIEKQGKVEFHVAPVMRNGENAWIALVERQTRDAAPEAQ